MKKIGFLFLLVLFSCFSANAAIDATVVWEVRTTGSQTNGGGWKPGASGVDYSQQAAAQYALTTVTSAGATATMTHASAAADMVGNTCRVVSGTNATQGWYEIVSVVAGVSLTVDRNWCTGACNNGAVNVGGAFKFGGTLDDDFTEAVSAGNTIYVQIGTYTLGESIAQAKDGTATAPIIWIGYTASRGDLTVGNDRPLIVCGSSSSIFGWYAVFRNFRLTTTASTGFELEGYGIAFNCKCQNTSGTVGRYAITIGGYGRAVACEAISDSGVGIGLSTYGSAVSCYVHDSVTGFVLSAHGTEVFSSVVDTCTTGISLAAYASLSIINNTIYGCTTGISGTTAPTSIFLNNIITECTTGASWTTAAPTNFWDYNCWNNTVDVSNVTKGPHDITADPLLNAPADGDFTLKSGSPCLDVGLQIGANEGVTGDYKQNIGVDQDDNAAAGGGGGATLYMGNF